VSFITGRFRFLTLRPRVRATPDRLTLSTGRVSALASLGLRLRRVEIDATNRRVDLATRTCWLFVRRHRLNFDELSHIDYGIGAFGTEWGWTPDGFGRQDQVESFSIALVTREGDAHKVCSFRGEGSVETGFVGWLGGDSWFDAAGTQAEDSRKMVEMLANVLGLPIGEPVGQGVPTRRCGECGHRVSARQSVCLYCGATMAGG